MSKPEKLFMQNTNISSALTKKADMGSAIKSLFGCLDFCIKGFV
jgi:hypothetical protein